jgi:anti-sigma-K factor RskA
METEIHKFLNSGLLDKYVVGDITPSEIKTVEQYINTYPEVKDEYDFLQDSLQIIAETNAVKPPKNQLSNILNKIDNKPVIKLSQRKKHISWLTIAASVAAIILGGTSYMLFDQNQKLLRENQVVVEEIFDLRSDIEGNNKMLDNLRNQFLQLNNPETEKYVLRGNARAKNLKTVAYINPVEKSSLIDVVSLPELPEEQCYQMWIELQDKMVSLGILDQADRKLKKVQYMEDALGLSITIEPRGGNTNASIENSVAKIPLRAKDN